MRIVWLGFGAVMVGEERFGKDLLIDGGRVRPRRKKASRPYRDRFGHTPLSVDEPIPWGGRRLIVGTGAYGQLPIMPEVEAEASARGVELVALPTPDACRLLQDVDPREVCAVIHVTC